MNAERSNRPIVLACDAGYAMPLATTIRSIAEANRSGWPLDFHVLSDGFSDETRKRVLDSAPQGSASIQWIPVNLDPFREFATISHISKMTYARFLIPSLFPETLSRVLYLDADILVLGDLGPLWETDLDGAVVGAIADVSLDLQLKQRAPGHEKLPRVRDYFNAGVLLIDLESWRKQRISEKSVEYLGRNPKSPYSDQDALNVACDGAWKPLGPEWNFQGHLETVFSEVDPARRPKIVHFVTSAKPWNAAIPNANAAFYDGFRSRTLFHRTRGDRVRDVSRRVSAQVRGVLRRSTVLRGLWRRFRGQSKP